MSQPNVRKADTGDASLVARLVRELAGSIGEVSDVAAVDVTEFLAHVGNGALLAEVDGDVVGLLTYSASPDLYHAGTCCQIREMVVRTSNRRQGIGSRLIGELVSLGATAGWREISVSTMKGVSGASEFYRKLGFQDEAILLERHFDRS